MNWKFLFTFIMIVGTFFSFSQSDHLNRLDSNDDKMSWWIIYLDNNLKQLDGITYATHCRRTYYKGGFDNNNNNNNTGRIEYDKNPIQFPENDPIKLRGLNLLNDTYTSKYKNGQIHYSLSAKNGILWKYKDFYSNRQLKTRMNYSEKFGTPLRNYIKAYDKEDKMKHARQNEILGD